MFRSLVTIAVLLGFVASQLAAVPHAHTFASSAEQRQHDARPHVHLGHSHAHGHSHHNDAHDDEPVVPDRGSSHDADAIDLPLTNVPATGSVAVAKAGQDHRAHSGQWVSALLSCVFHDRPIVGCVPWHPPDTGAASCALFLKLRNLRI
jgi:hypothetical protein